MLLDLSMPGLGGLRAIPMVVAASPQTKVVVLSAMGRNRFSQAALSAGAAAFLEKHMPSGSLVAQLNAALGDQVAARDLAKPAAALVEPLVADEYLTELSQRIGDAALQEILAGFRTCTQERLAQLRCAVDAGDVGGVVRLAHQIRGSARSLAAPRLARAAAELEELAATASIRDLRDHARRLQSMFENTDAALAALPAPRRPATEEPSCASPASVHPLHP